MEISYPKSIVCLMPMADGEMMDPEVMEGMSFQTVKLFVMPITRPKENYPKVLRAGRKSQTLSRNILREHGLKSKQPVYLLLDRDVKFSSSTDVQDLIKYLEDNKDVGYVAYCTKPERKGTIEFDINHVNIACALVRHEVLKRVLFHNGLDNMRCNCYHFTIDTKNAGWKACYLTDRILTEIK